MPRAEAARRAFALRFAIPGQPDVTTVTVRGLNEFDAVTGLIGRLAHEQAMSIQVDLRAAAPGPHDPVLIQFLVGDEDRSSLLWHEDGVGFAAVDPHLSARSHGVYFTGICAVECAPPEETQVTHATVRQALAVYVLTGRRTKWLAWREIPAD